MTKEHILTIQGIDVVSPTGTAIQNARTGGIGLLTRDGYHLSLDTGRYIAGMTFLKALTDTDVSDATFIDDARVRMIAVEAVNNAIADPFRISSSKL